MARLRSTGRRREGRAALAENLARDLGDNARQSLVELGIGGVAGNERDARGDGTRPASGEHRHPIATLGELAGGGGADGPGSDDEVMGGGHGVLLGLLVGLLVGSSLSLESSALSVCQVRCS
jgi:hypothetical protein